MAQAVGTAGGGGLREFEDIFGVGVDHGDAVIVPEMLEGCGVGLVDMAVNHDSGTMAVQQGAEAGEALMAEIRLIPAAADRGVGQENIEAAGHAQTEAKLTDAGGHLLL